MIRLSLLSLILVFAACATTEKSQRSQDPDPIEDPPLTARTDPEPAPTPAKTDPVADPASIPQEPAAQKRYVGASVDAFGAT